MIKEYIGDGCYAAFDGNCIELTTETGLSVTNRIYLEPETFLSLVRFRDKCMGVIEDE